MKVDISDHFPIFFSAKSINVKTSQDPAFIIKRNINPFKLPLFKENLLEVDWGLLYTIKNLNKPYKTFLNIFSNLYKISFPQIKIKVNCKIGFRTLFTR